MKYCWTWVLEIDLYRDDRDIRTGLGSVSEFMVRRIRSHWTSGDRRVMLDVPRKVQAYIRSYCRYMIWRMRTIREEYGECGKGMVNIPRGYCDQS